MPSLQNYSVRGKRYWRIVESYRDERGRPRLRVVRHLGTAQKLLDRLSQAPGRPLYAEERDFGATAALWDMAQQLDIVEHHRRPRAQTRSGSFCWRVYTAGYPESGDCTYEQAQTRFLVPGYYFGPASSAPPRRLAEPALLGPHELP